MHVHIKTVLTPTQKTLNLLHMHTCLNAHAVHKSSKHTAVEKKKS